MSSFREATDRDGRTTLEMRVDRGYLLVIGGFASTFVWFILQGGWLGSIAAALTVAGFSTAYQKKKTERRMRMVIDPRARTLTVTLGQAERVLKFSEVTRAQLNSEQRRKPDKEVHRIDLVLRSGEVLALMDGFPSEDKEETLRIIDVIDKAIA